MHLQRHRCHPWASLMRSDYGTRKLPPETRKTLLGSGYLCNLEAGVRGQTLTGGQLPRGHRREQAMILPGSAIIVAVLVALAVPCVRGTLMVRDARRRAGKPSL
jgi:hypothetical protein